MTKPPALAELAAEIPRELTLETLPAMLALLSENVRWGGDEDTDDTCHSRTDVGAWLRGLLGTGLEVQIQEVLVLDRHLLLRLWVTGLVGDQGFTRWELAAVERGQLVDVRPVDDEQDARARTGHARTDEDG
jgi:hypothetical protein